MGKVKIYISGPIAHYDLHERKHAFLMAKERLESQGYDPVNPFDNGVPDNAHWREHMRADIAMLLNSCFCSAKGHRECACNKYGQICKFYKKII